MKFVITLALTIALSLAAQSETITVGDCDITSTEIGWRLVKPGITPEQVQTLREHGWSGKPTESPGVFNMTPSGDALDAIAAAVKNTKELEAYTLTGKCPVTLESAFYKCSRDKYGGYCAKITANLRNRGNRQIKMISAAIEIRDILGELLLTIRVNQDNGLASGAIGDFGGMFDLNQYIPREIRLTSISPENVRVSLEVRKVAYADGEIVEYGNK
ncbi:MAG: hypothetical protein RLZZ214_1651 [Verrucomicrobiota bacterium]|jgi:hypothetical protein